MLCSHVPYFVSAQFPRILSHPTSRIINVDDHVTLRCDVTPESAVITWHYDDVIVSSDTVTPDARFDVRLLSADRLRVKLLGEAPADVSNQDGGFRCEATTEGGRVVSRRAFVTSPRTSTFVAALTCVIGVAYCVWFY